MHVERYRDTWEVSNFHSVPLSLFSQQMYAVVEFIGEGTVSAIPQSWKVDNKRCRWPSNEKRSSITTLIKQCHPPKPRWEVYDVIFRRESSKTFEKYTGIKFESKTCIYESMISNFVDTNDEIAL